jgi:hypothetical protein
MTRYRIPIRIRTRDEMDRSGTSAGYPWSNTSEVREAPEVLPDPAARTAQKTLPGQIDLQAENARSIRGPGAGSSEQCQDRAVCDEAGDQVQTAQDRMLRDVLSIADNLERALAVADQDTPIRQGVAITHSDVIRILRKHGLERIEADERLFDPHWHEAIAVVSAEKAGVDPGTVVEVMQSGYRRGKQLFRPARVVVAQ